MKKNKKKEKERRIEKMGFMLYPITYVACVTCVFCPSSIKWISAETKKKEKKMMTKAYWLKSGFGSSSSHQNF